MCVYEVCRGGSESTVIAVVAILGVFSRLCSIPTDPLFLVNPAGLLGGVYHDVWLECGSCGSCWKMTGSGLQLI